MSPLDAGSSSSVSGRLLPVVALQIAGGSAFWRVTTARKIAQSSGLDADLATQVSLLSENGLRPSTSPPPCGSRSRRPRRPRRRAILDSV